MKIAVCTPICGPPSWHYMDSMVHWVAYHRARHPDVPFLYLRPQRALPIDVARNLLVGQMLDTDATHLWFLDQDAAWRPQTLDRLLSWELPIISALEMMRLPGCCYPMALQGKQADGTYRVQAPEVYEFVGKHYDYMDNHPQMVPDPPPEDSLLPTGFTGCHCLLVERTVLERMEPPWFEGYNPGGEDQYFCEKAAALGIPTHIDMSVLVGHATTDRIIGAFDFMSGYRFIDEHKRLQSETAEMTEWVGQ